MREIRVSRHPLVVEAASERRLAYTPEAEKLKDAIFSAMVAYSKYLERNHLIWDRSYENSPRLKASKLVAEVDYAVEAGGSITINLIDGAIDRVFGSGLNPDPDGRGPGDIPDELKPI
jgi:hypothetical protein